MLSYRHAFHAGNHADILKHLVQVLALSYLARKPGKPLCYIDAHAGAGQYDLRGRFAATNREYETGIARLWQRADLPGPLADYMALVRAANPGDRLQVYPGSPFFAAALLAPPRRLHLFELHPDDAVQLQRWAAGERGVQVAQADGLAALRRLLPPVERRAFVIIDPPYEMKGDYVAVPAALGEALRRFATGVYALWYPLLDGSDASRAMIAGLAARPIRYLRVELCVSAAGTGGMIGSGMFVINPPWMLARQLHDCLPWLQAALAEPGAASWRIETGGEP